MRYEAATATCTMCARSAQYSAAPEDVEMQAKLDRALRPQSAEGG